MEGSSSPQTPGFGRVFWPLLARAALKLTGWRFAGDWPTVLRCVATGAPHTSWFDLVLALAMKGWYGLPLRWVAKKSLFWGPFGPALRALGGIPVDRGLSSGAVERLAGLFSEGHPVVLAVAPEGTRGRAEYWRTGFYRVAQRAGVPIVPVRVEAHLRTVRVCPPLWPTGDLEADFARLAEVYREAQGIVPDQVGPVRPRPAGPEERA